MAFIKEFTQSVTLPSGNSSVDVTLDYPQKDANYYLSLGAHPYQTSAWVTNKSSTGFTLNVGSTAAYDKVFVIKVEG